MRALRIIGGLFTVAVLAGPVGATSPRPAVPADARSAVSGAADAFATESRFLIAREHYVQEVRTPAASFGATAGRVTESRTTDAEVAFAQVVTDGAWMMTRRVDRLDGRPIAPDGGPRLDQATSEAEVLERLRGLANDGARWNIGRTWRNMNTPTLAIWFMTSQMADRFTFKDEGTERLPVAGVCRVVRFTETATPPVMHIAGTPARTHGRVWLEPGSGSVAKTELIVEGHRPDMAAERATVIVTYAPSTELPVWVPATMLERYEGGRDDPRVIATATYTDVRQFTVRMRIR